MDTTTAEGRLKEKARMDRMRKIKAKVVTINVPRAKKVYKVWVYRRKPGGGKMLLGELGPFEVKKEAENFIGDHFR